MNLGGNEGLRTARTPPLCKVLVDYGMYIFSFVCLTANNELTSTALRPHLITEAAFALISARLLATSENMSIAGNVQRTSTESWGRIRLTPK